MFSPQESPYYNAREGFDWDKIVSLIYSRKGKELAKAWLEHGINLNIVADKAPDHNIEGWDK